MPTTTWTPAPEQPTPIRRRVLPPTGCILRSPLYPTSSIGLKRSECHRVICTHGVVPTVHLHTASPGGIAPGFSIVAYSESGQFPNRLTVSDRPAFDDGRLVSGGFGPDFGTVGGASRRFYWDRRHRSGLAATVWRDYRVRNRRCRRQTRATHQTFGHICHKRFL